MSLQDQISQKINNIGEIQSLSILTVIDNDFIDRNLETCWGLSFYIEINKNPDKSILMDCSGSLYDFSQNVSKLNLDLTKLKAIHISHWHSDHCGCLNYILSSILKSSILYVPTGNNQVCKEIQTRGFNIFALEKPKKLFDGVFSTGTLKGGIPEQSLIFNIKGKGLVIILGCAHPGIISIIEQSKLISGISTVYGIVGGFHINNRSQTEELIKYLKK
ncbi:MAG: MBL fold metallo-hydrolase, partial [Promethearchaeota archaeon]